MEIDGAIFDLDGTLLDSIGLWFEAGRRYLMGQGVTPSSEFLQKLKPLQAWQWADLILEEYDIPASKEDITAELYRLMAENYRSSAVLKPGCLELLRRMRAAGVRLCIATATDRALFEPALRRLGLTELFHAILTCREAGHGKDRPDIYWKALDHLGTRQERTMVFEDSLHAIRTAAGAGFRVTAVCDRFSQSEEGAIRALAEQYITSFSQLLDNGEEDPPHADEIHQEPPH